MFDQEQPENTTTKEWMQHHVHRDRTQTLLRTNHVTHRSFYTQTLLHTDAFTHRHFHTQRFLHTEAFTHRRFYTQTLLHTDIFTHRRFHTQRFLHTDAFTHRCFYTQKLLYIQTLLHRHFFHTYAFTITTLLRRGGRSKCKLAIRRCFGGGPMKMYAYNCFFFIVFIARLHFDRFVDCNYVPPRFTDLQLFSRGGRPILQVAIYGNKCKNMEKNARTIVWRSANSCRIA